MILETLGRSRNPNVILTLAFSMTEKMVNTELTGARSASDSKPESGSARLSPMF